MVTTVGQLQRLPFDETGEMRDFQADSPACGHRMTLPGEFTVFQMPPRCAIIPV